MVDLDAIVELSLTNTVLLEDGTEEGKPDGESVEIHLVRQKNGSWKARVDRGRWYSEEAGATANEAAVALHTRLQKRTTWLVSRLQGMLRRFGRSTAKVLRLAKGEDDAG